VTAAGLMLVVVFLGFSKTFYLRALMPGEQRLPLATYLYIHGVVMTAWYLLFALQAFLIASHRTRLHRRMGVAGAVLAVAVVVTGAYASLGMPGRIAALGAPADVQLAVGLGITIGNLVRLISFAGLVATALALRRRPQWHGRLMLWSFLLTLDPAFGGGGSRPLGPMVESFIGAWFPLHYFVPIVGFVALVAHDWSATRRIHPATLVGGIVYMLYGGPLPAMIAGTPQARVFVQSLI
jgi:hypothetical protein